MANKAQELQSKIVGDFVKKLEAGLPPWDSPYLNTFKNARRHNGELYRGINSMVLLFMAMEMKYSSAHWLTYKQAKALGGQVRKGEKSTPVFFYKHVQRDDATHPQANADGQVDFKFLRVSYAFNADQINGLDKNFYPQSMDVDNQSARDILSKLMQVPANIKTITHTPSAYNFKHDVVEITEPEMMKSEYRFSSTLAHELLHWSGGKGRLDRGFHAKMTKDEYAMEELIVTVGTCLLCASFGVNPDHMDNHASYLAHYVKMLKAKPSILFKAAAEAQRAIDYLQQFWTDKDMKIAA